MNSDEPPERPDPNPVLTWHPGHEPRRGWQMITAAHIDPP
jgi:hypothetical protein